MMTRKNFIALADTLKNHNLHPINSMCEFNDTQIEAIANFCSEQSENFNKERWILYVKNICKANGRTPKPLK